MNRHILDIFNKKRLLCYVYSYYWPDFKFSVAAFAPLIPPPLRFESKQWTKNNG